MKLALCQMSNAGSVEKNLQKSLQAIQDAAAQGADLILFPEVQLTYFFPQYSGRDVSEYGVTIDSPIVKAFQTACRQAQIMAVPNVYLFQNGNYYDASLFIDKNGEIIGIQKMVHVAYADQFFESDYYTPSDDGFHVFDTRFGKIGIVVCFDRHYPESIRTEALMGADLVLIPTVNTIKEPMELFEQEIRVQAFQNSVYIAMANRVGKEDQMVFAGESLVVSPEGQTMKKADHTEQILFTEIEDLRHAGRLREEKPYTALRRVDLYK
jgi:predicted amidohydrolase